MIDTLFPADVTVLRASDAMWEGSLAPTEAACIRKAVKKRRREFTAGRRCARQALRSLGIEDFALVPDDDRVPRWPDGVVGSISHTHDYCAVAVARSEAFAGLGLDVERAGGLSSEIVARVCRPSELARLEGVPPPAGTDWPKLLFSVKESVYKCYFPLARTPLGFHDVEVRFDPNSRAFEAELLLASAPSAVGRRRFAGRYVCGGEYVASGVSLRVAPAG